MNYPGFGGLPKDPTISSLDDLYRWVVAQLNAGPYCLVAQSMGGILATRLALEFPSRVSHLVLVATSGGVDVQRLGARDWRPAYLAEHAGVPDYFVKYETDLTAQLRDLRVPTALLFSDCDPVSPLSVGRFLEATIPGSRLVLLHGGSHGFAEEFPDEVAQAIRSHLTAPA